MTDRDAKLIPSAHLDAAAARLDEVGPDMPLPAGRISDLVAAIDKAIRSQRLYQPNNPVYRSFITAAQRTFAGLWDEISSFTVSVEEAGFRWYGRLFPMGGEGRDTLPFLLFKDGVRYITFLPGFEDEIEAFLDVVNRGRSQDQNSDEDMVTLLWQQEFTSFQYSYVDALAEGLLVPGSAIPKLAGIDLTLVRQDAAAGPAAAAPPQQGTESDAPAPSGIIDRSEFEQTLYFLDQTELATLRREVEMEFERDLKTDVLNALFDRLEDGDPRTSMEILRILRQLLPAFLGAGDLSSAARVLIELSTLLEKGTFEGEIRDEAVQLFHELSEPTVLTQFMQSLQDGSIDPTGEELGVFLRHLGPAAMPVLLYSIERGDAGALQDRLRNAMQGLADAHRDELVGLLSGDDPHVLRGAARLSGQLALVAAALPLGALLDREEPLLRRTAVEALMNIRSTAALEAVQRALGDEDRDVRVAAARALAALRHPLARTRLAELLDSRIVRDADLTEKIAFFEAYAAVAGAESVPLLDRILNGRRLLGRENPEMRACAALALGRITTPPARAALQRAAAESNPVIRNAVTKALREEPS
ncbi:hypothetical protein BH23GEM9_BH23GEM9_18000 [soil metagenome]